MFRWRYYFLNFIACTSRYLYMDLMHYRAWAYFMYKVLATMVQDFSSKGRANFLKHMFRSFCYLYYSRLNSRKNNSKVFMVHWDQALMRNCKLGLNGFIFFITQRKLIGEGFRKVCLKLGNRGIWGNFETHTEKNFCLAEFFV